MSHSSEEQRAPETAPGAEPGAVTPEAELPPVIDGDAEELPLEAPETDEEASPEPETEIERLTRERAEYLELAQRSRAELENYRRRISGEATSAEQRGRATVARGVLPALDNLERALLAAGVDPEGIAGASADGEPISQEVSAHTALAEGIALVYREFREGMRRAGVEAFDPSGERFDPALHEAIATDESEGSEKGVVVEVMEKGYRLGDHVLRPARVVVGG